MSELAVIVGSACATIAIGLLVIGYLEQKKERKAMTQLTGLARDYLKVRAQRDKAIAACKAAEDCILDLIKMEERHDCEALNQLRTVIWTVESGDE